MWFVKGEWGKILKEQADQYLLLITEMIDQGKENGEIRKDVISDLASGSFFAHYLSVLLFGLNNEEFKPDELIVILELLINQTMDGIRAKS